MATTVDNPAGNPPIGSHTKGRSAASGRVAQRGSNNRGAKKQETVGARHRQIANRRKDFHHKQARQWSARFMTCWWSRTPPITNMVRRAKPKPDPDNPGQFLPNGARAKSGLNRRISDAGWGQFV